MGGIRGCYYSQLKLTYTHTQNDTERSQLLTREYALYCHGRFVSQAMGEHSYFSKSNIQYGKACEAAKSNALMRCCKDLGVASELWDPQVIMSIAIQKLGYRTIAAMYRKKYLMATSLIGHCVLRTTVTVACNL